MEDSADRMSDNDRLKAFLKGKDFLKVGQAVSKGNWQIAAMTVTRMISTAKELELGAFDRPLEGLKYSIMHRDMAGAKNALSVVIAKRVALYENLDK